METVCVFVFLCEYRLCTDTLVALWIRVKKQMCSSLPLSRQSKDRRDGCCVDICTNHLFAFSLFQLVAISPCQFVIQKQQNASALCRRRRRERTLQDSQPGPLCFDNVETLELHSSSIKKACRGCNISKCRAAPGNILNIWIFYLHNWLHYLNNLWKSPTSATGFF